MGVEDRPAAGSFRRRALCVAAAALAGAALLSACGKANEEAPAPGTTPAAPAASDGASIKVGVLHSLSGTMSISEVAVKDATLLAIEEINKAGGVLGKQLVPVVEDGASDWPTFNEKARKLVQQDAVAVVFGGWRWSSRKAMLPSFEELNGLLFYPVQYEGLEQSPNIFYTGAEPSQQIVPAVDYLLEKGKKRIYLLGSDYVFPRTANKIIKAQLAAKGGELAGEEYLPLGGTEVSTIISKIGAAKPDAIFNTLNGDSNVAFFKQFKDAGYTADKLPVLSVSVAEEEVRGIGAENIAGHLVSWNYYQTTDTPENKKFVDAYKAKYGPTRATSGSICGSWPSRRRSRPRSPR
jgi:urea transport system substrate-binding protein